MFRNKSAYPVYLTIGNISKEIRRKPSKQAQVLIAYLPATKLDHIKDKGTRRHALASLFHACMRRVLEPTIEAAMTGIEMASGDGVIRRCHLILAAFIGDYPEQVLVACCKYGHCPKCLVSRQDIGENEDFDRRSLRAAQDALSLADDDPGAWLEACSSIDLKPIHNPFWENLPYSNIFQAITPDLLHQLYQGVIKHLVSWLKMAFGPHEIDARCRRMPANHNLRYFSGGITPLSRISGQEHKDICRILLGLIVDLPLQGGHSPARLICTVRALLDFVYLAQYPSHTDTTLEYLQEAYDKFHANKDIFLELGIRRDFNIPKIHSLRHYIQSVKLLGTADNFNTEYTERLHIDYTKDAYRASNRKDEYPQMTTWLQRKEKIIRHSNFIKWRLLAENNAGIHYSRPLPIERHLHINVAAFPNETSVNFTALMAAYRATDFESALYHRILQIRDPGLSTRQLRQLSAGSSLPFNTVNVYHRIKFWNPDAQGRDECPDTLDSAHARPSYVNTQGKHVPARFDTVLVKVGEGQDSGVEGLSSSAL